MMLTDSVLASVRRQRASLLAGATEFTPAALTWDDDGNGFCEVYGIMADGSLHHISAFARGLRLAMDDCLDQQHASLRLAREDAERLAAAHRIPLVHRLDCAAVQERLRRDWGRG